MHGRRPDTGVLSMRPLDNRRKRTRLLALCAVLSALGVILLYLGSIFEVIDLSMAVLASFLAIILTIEVGGGYPWLVYGVTALLSLLLLPNKFSAVTYTAFLGFYPIIKEKLEKIPMRALRLLVKLLVFNGCMMLMWGLAMWLIGGELQNIGIATILLLLNGIFVFYDYALTVMITSYLRVWRKRLRLDRFFDQY